MQYLKDTVNNKETMNIKLIYYFVEVVTAGGFTKASKRLNIPKSTLSKAVTMLEKKVKVKLLFRSTRKQALTIAGEAFYRSCLGPIQALNQAQKSLYAESSIISGIFKITAPEDLGRRLISPKVVELCKLYPELNFDLIYTNEILDLPQERIDLAIRLGPLKESSLYARKVGRVKMILASSAKYLEKSSKIMKPSDLDILDCIGISGTKYSKVWELSNGKASSKIKVQSRIQVNEMSALVDIIASGFGVSLLPSFICKDEIKNKVLVRVLDEWSVSSTAVHLVSPHSTKESKNLKVISDYILNHIKKAIE